MSNEMTEKEGYRESKSHRPNPTDMVGTIDTTQVGAGAWGDVSEVSLVTDTEDAPEVVQRITRQIKEADEGTAATEEAEAKEEEDRRKADRRSSGSDQGATKSSEGKAKAADNKAKAKSKGGDADDLADEYTYEELREKANELNVSGRSSMDKEALAKAVAEAEASGS